MNIFEWFYKKRLERARHLLAGEIDATVRIRLEESATGLRTSLITAQSKARRAEEHARATEEELDEASQSYAQQVEELTSREQRIKEALRMLSEKTKTDLESLANAHRAATTEAILGRFPEAADKLGLNQGIVELYRQQRGAIEGLLTYARELSNHVLVVEAENLETKEPRLARWPIAVVRGGEVIYSTRKFQRRLKSVAKVELVRAIESNKAVYSALCRGEESLIQVNSRSEIYNLSLVPHKRKGADAPDAIFAYLSPPEHQEKLGKAVGKMVRDMKEKMYQKLGKFLSHLPEQPSTNPSI
ncbi:MAG: hypothetical protein KKB21_00135 [Nanoarchaeota archaeon]|nr:hypothetical protein [Nanoarchaeota archaeon]MBU4085967.1 hypothetical protein [Nanoarchaeota archaeon]